MKPRHKIKAYEAKRACNGHYFKGWADKALFLHELDPKTYTPAALGRLFKKRASTLWWACHPEWNKERKKEYNARPEVIARNKAKDARRYQRMKDDPEFKARRAEACSRARARARNNKKLGWTNGVRP